MFLLKPTVIFQLGLNIRILMAGYKGPILFQFTDYNIKKAVTFW
jgi:hypothetical protein